MFSSPTAVRGRLKIVSSWPRVIAMFTFCSAALVAGITGPVGLSHADAPPPAGSPAGQAKTYLTPNSGLDELIRYALENNPAVAAAFHSWRAAVERVPQARALPDPRLGLGVVYDQVDSDAEYMGERYSISQMFPWFGELALKEDIALQEAAVQARKYEAARLELLERVTYAWLEYAWLSEAVTTAEENRSLMLRLESVARAMYRAGSVSQADVTRAQVELGRLDDQWRSLQDRIGPAAAALNAVLGRPAHAPLPETPPAPSRQAIAGLPEREDQAWLELARDANPGLAAYQHEVERERQSVELARKQYYPDITLGVEYGRDASARMARMDGGGADMVIGMISINIPIWRGRYDAGVKEAQARLAAAASEVQQQEHSLETELKDALFSYRDSQRRLSLYGGTLVPKARQSLAATEAAYRAGDAGFSDLVDAQRMLLEFQLAHERAAADRGLAAARVRVLAGESSGNYGSNRS